MNEKLIRDAVDKKMNDPDYIKKLKKALDELDSEKRGEEQ